MTWLRLTLECSAGQVDEAVALLEKFGALSSSISSPGGEPRFEELAPGPYWNWNRVEALLPEGADLDILLACLRNRVGTANLRNPRIDAVADRDWVRAGQVQHGSLVFGGRLCICPSWETPPEAEHLIVLDPGLAFGTGSHATTALCLEWLAGQDLHGRSVVDYGCGSGVLALASAALGAARVLAVDNDPQALEATRENARRNGLDGIIAVSGSTEMSAPSCADVLLSNILLVTLTGLAPRFAAWVRPGGLIALSGLLSVQAETCEDAYRAWFTFAPAVFRDEWALLHGRRLPDGGMH